MGQKVQNFLYYSRTNEIINKKLIEIVPAIKRNIERLKTTAELQRTKKLQNTNKTKNVLTSN